MKKIIVFASGSGSNFQALAEACQNSKKESIVLLVASKKGIGAIEKAKNFNIPVFIEASGDLTEELKKFKPDLICLAGYLKKIPPSILALCPIMNIHPALLPKYGGKGMHGIYVHEAVLKSGDKISGATVHFIDEEYDKGKIILQKSAPVLAGDTPQTLAKRVLEVEHQIYPAAVKEFFENN
ncbi:MAG: phosphoribosylglycinamide formyltransferase [Elusimicrobiota bacterium]|jgi:formyltetrahydrofolate-dependent phosphoribosylglycinamide formyltransferase|nr:phosphoribosylglycinamide formyltransferase [Elusimicrobiota bacterium]